MAVPPTVILLVSCFACLVVFVRAQDNPVSAPGRGGSRAAYPAAAVKRGHEQFLKTCSFCHGANAAGATDGPNLILSKVVRHDDNGSQIGPVLRQGRTDKGMPAFDFSDAQITDIAAFLHARMAASDVRSANHAGNYALEKLLTGNPAAGKAFFFHQGGCSACHSPAGDLAGIAGKYSPFDLQSRMLYPPHSHKIATVTGKSGQQWKGTLSLLTNFDIAIQDSNGWYRSWPLHSVTYQIDNPLAAHLALLSKYSDTEMHNVFAYLESLK